MRFCVRSKGKGMLSRRIFVCSAAAATVAPGVFAVAADAPAPDVAATLAKAMEDDNGYPCSGMVAGLCDARGQRIVTRGVSDAVDGRAALDGDTVFDIG